ncbi:hypothetical protein [Thalassiella azotivora]
MTEAQALFDGLVAILGRHHRVSGVDPAAGTLELHEDERTVRLTLPPDRLAELYAQLDEHDVPDLAHATPDARDGVLTRRVAVWVEEIVESDLSRSLLEVRLERSADGRISIEDRRGPPRRRVPPASGDGGYWTASRPGT